MASAWAIFIGGVLCVACLGYQVVMWLKTGAWISMGLLDTAASLPLKLPWLSNPQDWFGLHSALNFLNAGAVAAVIGCVLGYMLASQE